MDYPGYICQLILMQVSSYAKFELVFLISQIRHFCQLHVNQVYLLEWIDFFSSPSSDKAVRKELMSLIAPFYDYLMKFGNNTPLAKFTLFLENLGNLVVFTWFIFSPHLKKEAWGRN